VSLRQAIVAIGVVLIIGAALAGVETGRPAPAIGPALLGILVLLGTLFERVRYRSLECEQPGPDWQRTSERFRDPETNARIEVFFNPATGERRYVRRNQG
jgi:hypothetical protein